VQPGAWKITQQGPFQVVGKFLGVKNTDAIARESQTQIRAGADGWMR
jgi:hypothetical protein